MTPAQETSERELLALAGIPSATSEQAAGGWKILFDWIERTRDESDTRTGYDTTIESVHDIVLATLRLVAATRAAGDAPALTYADGIEAAAKCAESVGLHTGSMTQERDMAHRILPRVARAIRALSVPRPQRGAESNAL